MAKLFVRCGVLAVLAFVISTSAHASLFHPQQQSHSRFHYKKPKKIKMNKKNHNKHRQQQRSF